MKWNELEWNEMKWTGMNEMNAWMNDWMNEWMHWTELIEWFK